MLHKRARWNNVIQGATSIYSADDYILRSSSQCTFIWLMGFPLYQQAIRDVTNSALYLFDELITQYDTVMERKHHQIISLVVKNDRTKGVRGYVLKFTIAPSNPSLTRFSRPPSQVVGDTMIVFALLLLVHYIQTTSTHYY